MEGLALVDEVVVVVEVEVSREVRRGDGEASAVVVVRWMELVGFGCFSLLLFLCTFEWRFGFVDSKGNCYYRTATKMTLNINYLLLPFGFALRDLSKNPYTLRSRKELNYGSLDFEDDLASESDASSTLNTAATHSQAHIGQAVELVHHTVYVLWRRVLI